VHVVYGMVMFSKISFDKFGHGGLDREPALHTVDTVTWENFVSLYERYKLCSFDVVHTYIHLVSHSAFAQQGHNFHGCLARRRYVRLMMVT
jgi:hypothetical protein